MDSRLYGLFLGSLLVFILSLFFLEDARKIVVQFLWSLYLLWLFWILARSKTFTWKTYSAFFLAGAWVIPFSPSGLWPPYTPFSLKVPKRAPDEALETMRKVIEERLNIKWSTEDRLGRETECLKAMSGG